MTPAHSLIATAVVLGPLFTLYLRDRAERRFVRSETIARIRQRRYEFICGWSNDCQTIPTLMTCERLAKAWLSGQQQATALAVIERRGVLLLERQPKIFNPFPHHLPAEYRN